MKRLIPLLDRVLVQRAEAVTKTKGGIVIPEKAQQKVQTATVVAVGPGARNKDGGVIPMSVAVGDKVLLPEYGGTKVSYCQRSPSYQNLIPIVSSSSCRSSWRTKSCTCSVNLTSWPSWRTKRVHWLCLR